MDINDELFKKFNEIYNNFNDKEPLSNPLIQEKLKSEKNNILNNFIKFCDFLIIKINNSTNKKEIKKIPLIISNISSYK
jgi:hypothetical protein